MEISAADNPYPELDVGRCLERVACAIARDAAVEVARIGSLFTLFFRRGPVRNMADARACDTAAFAAFFTPCWSGAFTCRRRNLRRRSFDGIRSKDGIRRGGDASLAAPEPRSLIGRMMGGRSLMPPRCLLIPRRSLSGTVAVLLGLVGARVSQPFSRAVVANGPLLLPFAAFPLDELAIGFSVADGYPVQSVPPPKLLHSFDSSMDRRPVAVCPSRVHGAIPRIRRDRIQMCCGRFVERAAVGFAVHALPIDDESRILAPGVSWARKDWCRADPCPRESPRRPLPVASVAAGSGPSPKASSFVSRSQSASESASDAALVDAMSQRAMPFMVAVQGRGMPAMSRGGRSWASPCTHGGFVGRRKSLLAIGE
jgi:hypothetical protein